MSIQEELGGSSKKITVLIGLIIVMVVFVAYLAYSYLNQSQQPKSAYSLSGLTDKNPTQKNNANDAEYSKLLDNYNQENAMAAEKTGNSFIGNVKTTQPTKPNTASTTPAKTDLSSSYNYQPVNQVNVDDDKQNEQAIQFLTALDNKWKPTHFTNASLQGTDKEYTGWTNSLALTNDGTAPNARNASVLTHTLITANTRMPAIIETAVDSDNPASLVIAHIPSGQFTGATVVANGVQLAGDGLVIKFTSMTWHHKTYSILAYALDDNSLQSSIASDVNHRYFSRIILPALAGGIGQLGDLYKNANTKVDTNNNATVTSTGMPSGKQIAGVMVGGVAQKTSEVMQADAGKLPITQVTVNQGQVIAIQFVQPVIEEVK